MALGGSRRGIPGLECGDDPGDVLPVDRPEELVSPQPILSIFIFLGFSLLRDLTVFSWVWEPLAFLFLWTVLLLLTCYRVTEIFVTDVCQRVFIKVEYVCSKVCKPCIQLERVV